MNRFKYFFVCLLCFLLILPISFKANAETELALFEEIPMVITASKKLQPITEAPASVYVVTQEDIKQSGSMNLWDALRMVPGMDVVSATPGHGIASMRGFADLGGNKTLLLVDGRSVYLPLQGVLLWESLHIQPEEIERIEVVKGPVASLYGANANLGLINIITKKPEDLENNIVSATVGNKNARRFSAVVADKKDSVSYKISTGWKEADNFNIRGNDSLDTGSVNAFVELDLADDEKLAFSAGANHGEFEYYYSPVLISQEAFYGPLDNTSIYLKSDYENGGLKALAYWNHYDALWETPKFAADILINTFNTEFSYEFDVDNQSFIAGIGGQYDYAESSLFTTAATQDQDQVIYYGYIQDDIKLSDEWLVNSSIRVDHYSENDEYNPSFRLATIYTPNNTDTFRAGVGYSFRSPTLTEYFVNLPINVTAANTPGAIANFLGNEALEPERYLTYELSYQGRRMDGRFRPFIDLFFTEIRSFIDAVPNGAGPVGANEQFQNSGKAFSSGGEIGGEFDLTDDFVLIFNYAYNNVEYDSLRPESFFHPKNKVNGGFKWKGMNDKLNISLLAHFVQGDETTAGTDDTTEDYVMSSLYVGYKINDSAEISLSGQNVFHDKHVEFTEADEIGSRVLAKLEYKF